jgi:hypothetical protein
VRLYKSRQQLHHCKLLNLQSKWRVSHFSRGKKEKTPKTPVNVV